MQRIRCIEEEGNELVAKPGFAAVQIDGNGGEHGAQGDEHPAFHYAGKREAQAVDAFYGQDAKRLHGAAVAQPVKAQAQRYAQPAVADPREHRAQ